MLDRLISGAGALTDGSDRAVRALSGGSRRGFASTRPGSLLVVALLAVLAGMLVLAGLEATDPSTPVVLTPATIVASRDLGDRTFSTIRGSLSSTYAEYFSDDNLNGKVDEGEATVWYYWLVDQKTRAGVTVRSTRAPESLFTFHAFGTLTDAPAYARETVDPYDDDARRAGLSIEPGLVIDNRATAGTLHHLDLAGTLPPTGTFVEFSGARLGPSVGVCPHDPNVDPGCPTDEQSLVEIMVFDPASRHAIRVLLADSGIPEFNVETDLTGLLRREERTVDETRTDTPDAFHTFDVTISDRYVLDEAVAGATAPLTFALAGLVVALAGVILVGWAGGYLIYRRSDRGLPVPASSLGAGERIPLRITGVLRTPTGLEHVREAPGALIRFVLGRPVTTSHAGDGATREPAETGEPTEAGEPPGAGQAAAEAAEPTAEAGEPVAESPIATTLIVERTDTPQGIAVGSGELTRLSSGQVMTLRTPRPALRAVAATGPLFLSFESEADRDRAAAELLAEAGLGPDGTSPPIA